jgi:hypothetical protein
MHEPNDELALDGNAAAGMLSQVFAVDVTTARLVCLACDAEAPVAEARLYGGAMGAVFRCAHCDNVVMRLVRTPSAFWLEMTGARSLQLRAR